MMATTSAMTFRAALGGFLLFFLLTPAAQGQTYPSKPMSLIVGSAAGGSVDFASRLYAERVSRDLGQPIVIENRPGAGGIVAAEYLKRQPPDGYTLLMVQIGLMEITPSLQALPFDVVKDFTYISPALKSDTYLVVRADLPITTLAQYVALAKSKNGGLTLGHTASGGPPGLAMSGLQLASGISLVEVKYRASQQVLPDLAAGRLDSAIPTYLVIRPLLDYQGGSKVRMLAVNSDVRSKRFPDVPTFAEVGYPGVAVGTWWGLFGPANLPAAITEQLHAAFSKAAADPELIRRFGDQDIEPVSMSTEAFLATTAANRERLAKLIAQIGLKPD
jgi:tripartite-type tricarboxylate transporter receptor subunit TctC